jgi:hypothetical protein
MNKNKRKSKGKRGSTANFEFGEWPFLDGVPSADAEELEKLRTALKVIYTWACVEQEYMNQHHVMQLIERTLKMNGQE